MSSVKEWSLVTIVATDVLEHVHFLFPQKHHHAYVHYCKNMLTQAQNMCMFGMQHEVEDFSVCVHVNDSVDHGYKRKVAFSFMSQVYKKNKKNIDHHCHKSA